MKLLETVVLLTDLPEHDLIRGQVGTIVEDLSPDVFLVEFSDDEGRTYGLLPLEMGQLVEARGYRLRFSDGKELKRDVFVY